LPNLGISNQSDFAMLRLFQFPPNFGVPNPSPFCLKVETWLRMAGMDYQVKTVFDPRKAPKGKLPFIELDGRVIADSEIILRTLKATGTDLDAHLDAAGRARGLCITRLCDEHLAPLILYFRWVTDAGWVQTRPAFFGKLPAPLQLFVPRMIRNQTRKALRSQGLGRHTPEELLLFAREDLQALSDLLGDSAFFGGEQPCSADAAAYGVLANIILATLETPIGQMARQEFPALVAYCERLRSQFWA